MTDKYKEKYGFSEKELRAGFESLPFDDNPPTEADLKYGKMKLVAVGMPAFEEYLAKRGRPKKEVRKEVVNISFEPDDLKYLRASGRGWQTRLREYVEQGISSGAL